MLGDNMHLNYQTHERQVSGDSADSVNNNEFGVIQLN